MTETPQGPQTPQPHEPQYDQPLDPYAAPPARHPYAGPEWRPADAGSTTPQPPYAPPTADPYAPVGAAAPAGHGVPADEPRPTYTGAPAGMGGGPRGPSGPGTPVAPGGGPWPYAAPARQDGRPRRGGRQLIAVAAVTAVVGGLIGGGAVAAFDSGGTTVAASGISRDTSTAPTSANQSGTVEAAAATAQKSVVTLTVRGSQESGTGSGVVIRADGYVLTNEHVVAAAGSGGTITVAFADGRTATAKLVGTDKATDLAVVKVSGVSGLTAATFADSDAVKVGQTVVAVGSPLGLDGTVTEGIVSALHRPATGASDNSAVIDALQTDAAINPGNSGGALVDLAGRVVGINQSIATAGSGSGFGQQSGGSGNIGIGFAIPANTAAGIAEQLIATGTASHGFLGVSTSGSSSASGGTSNGASLASVQAGGPAAAAGLQASDVVTKVDGRVISEADELVAAIRALPPGHKVTLTVQRSGSERTVTVTLGSDAKQ